MNYFMEILFYEIFPEKKTRLDKRTYLNSDHNGNVEMWRGGYL